MKRLFGIIHPYHALCVSHILFMVSGMTYALAWILGWGEAAYMEIWYARVVYAFSVIAGFSAGVVLLFCVLTLSFDIKNVKLKTRHIVAVCLVAYMVVLALTSGVYGRIFTAEVFLMFTWATIELCVIYVCYYFGLLGKVTAFISVVLVGFATGLGSVFYNYYYDYTGDFKFNLGFYPYVVLVFVMFIIALFLMLERKQGRRFEFIPNTWEPGFKRNGYVTYIWWVVLAIVFMIPAVAYLVVNDYRNDMIASIATIGMGAIFLVVYMPPGHHNSVPGWERFAQSERRKGVKNERLNEVLDLVAAELGKKGYSVEKYYDQRGIYDVELIQMSVLQVRNPDTLVIGKIYYGWPNAFRTDIQFFWGEKNGKNSEVCKVVGDIIRSQL